jgi:hypothetical protein
MVQGVQVKGNFEKKDSPLCRLRHCVCCGLACFNCLTSPPFLIGNGWELAGLAIGGVGNGWDWIYLYNWELYLGMMRLQTRHIVVEISYVLGGRRG